GLCGRGVAGGGGEQAGGAAEGDDADAVAAALVGGVGGESLDLGGAGLEVRAADAAGDVEQEDEMLAAGRSQPDGAGEGAQEANDDDEAQRGAAAAGGG